MARESRPEGAPDNKAMNLTRAMAWDAPLAGYRQCSADM